MDSAIRTHYPATAEVPAGLGAGNMAIGALQLEDIRGVSGIFSVDDGKQRQLDIVANSANGSAVTLGTWDAQKAEVTPVVTVTSSGVNSTQPVSAPTVNATTVVADSITDGVATLANGALTGVRSLNLTESFQTPEVHTQALVIGEAGAAGSFRMRVATDKVLAIEMWDIATGAYKRVTGFALLQ